MRTRFFFETRVLVATAALVALVFTNLVNAGDGGPAEGPEPRSLAPTRLISLVPAITETLFALGLGERVVGVSTYCDFPPEARTLPKVGTFSEPVAEAIVALHPDLVLTSPSPGNESAVRALERAGVRVAVVQSEGGLAESRSAMLTVAEVVGVKAEGERLLTSIDARLEAVRSATSSLDKPRVAVVVGRDPLVLAGPASYLGELAVLAGGVNVADPVGGRWPRVGLEYLVQSAPQVLVDLSVSMGEKDSEGALFLAWSSIAKVPAIASGRVVGDERSVMLRPGPRLGEAAVALAVALHPGFVLPGQGRGED
jgi:iron complex transport system substrate-binding protein